MNVFVCQIRKLVSLNVPTQKKSVYFELFLYNFSTKTIKCKFFFQTLEIVVFFIHIPTRKLSS